MEASKKGFRVVVVAATSMLVLATAPDGTFAGAHDRGKHNSLVGLWYLEVPVPGPIVAVTGFMRVNADGTLVFVRNVDKGGPPPPFVPVPDMSSSAGQGLWRRAGHRRFEGMAVVINYDNSNGAPIGMLRFRFNITLDPGGDTATADYVDAWWFCNGALPCPPDPTVVPPDLDEPPEAFPWSLSRIRMEH